MPEKREGMEKWDQFVTTVLSKRPLKIDICKSDSAEVPGPLDTL